MFRKIIFSIGIVVCTLLLSAQEAKNITGKKWYPHGNKKCVLIDKRTNEIFCKNDNPKFQTGAWQIIYLTEKTPVKLEISAESKSANIPQNLKTDSKYSIWADLTFTDGTKKYGRIIPFSKNNHDWEKKTLILNEKKVIKQINIHLLFNQTPGEAIFRNFKVLQFSAGN